MTVKSLYTLPIVTLRDGRELLSVIPNDWSSGDTWFGLALLFQGILAKTASLKLGICQE